MQKLVDYIDKHYRKKKHTPFGSKKTFGDANNKSQQQVTNMLAEDTFIVVNDWSYRKSNAVYITRGGITYVRCSKLTGQLK